MALNRTISVDFQAQYFVAACDGFESLKEAGINDSSVSCVQRQSNGAILTVFSLPEFKAHFLQCNFINIYGSPLALQDVD